ncbi:MAG: SgcJ/EcaC family oxidoreductase [Gemmatimonadota bacterium]
MFLSTHILCAIVTFTAGVAPWSGSQSQELHNMPTESSKASTDAEADIRALIASQAAAWNRHDAAAWASPFVPSAEFINILGTPFSGKAAIEGITSRIFASIFKDSHDSVTVRKIVMVTPELAIAHYEHAVSGYTALPPGIQPSEVGADGKGVLRTLMVYVLQRSVEGKWMIVNGQNTAILPAFKGS